MCACLRVYHVNSVSLCCSAGGAVRGSGVRGAHTQMCLCLLAAEAPTHAHTHIHTKRNTHSGLCAPTEIKGSTQGLISFEGIAVGGRGVFRTFPLKIGPGLMGGHLLSHNTQNALWFLWSTEGYACWNIVYITVMIFLGNPSPLSDLTQGQQQSISESRHQLISRIFPLQELFCPVHL